MVQKAFEALSGNIVMGDANGKPAYAYLRLATEGQFDEDTIGAFNRQLYDAAENACKYGLKIVAVFGDVASGNSESRSGMVAMLEQMRAHPQVKFLVVPHVDRVARDVGIQLMLLQELNQAGIQVFDDEGQVSVLSNRMMIGEMFAVYEKNKLVSRMQAGKRVAKARRMIGQGRLPGGSSNGTQQ